MILTGNIIRFSLHDKWITGVARDGAVCRLLSLAPASACLITGPHCESHRESVGINKSYVICICDFALLIGVSKIDTICCSDKDCDLNGAQFEQVLDDMHTSMPHPHN